MFDGPREFEFQDFFLIYFWFEKLQYFKYGLAISPHSLKKA